MRGMRMLGVMVCVGVLAGCGVAGWWRRANTTEAQKTSPAPLQKKPLAWGVMLDGYPIDHARLKATKKALGRTPGLVGFFLAWPGVQDDAMQAAPFPRESLEAIQATGAMPCLTWEPMRFVAGGEEAISSEEILSGAYDPYLRRMAHGFRTWAQPVIIRFAHEMNLSRYHWGGAAAAYDATSPERYRQMFRYVVELFRKEGADAVRWAFCPNMESVPGGEKAAWNRAVAYYPGDAWVDVLGMDGYNWGTSRTVARDGWQSSWRSFAEMFGPLRSELKALAPDKPLMVFETGCAPDERKRQWLADAVATACTWELEGVVFFHVNKEVDWRFPAQDLRYAFVGHTIAPRLSFSARSK